MGTGCGTCKACDGTGQCATTPPDDKNCGVIDCDKLDSKCTDYSDLTSARCGSFGWCKQANEAASCAVSTSLCGGDSGASKPDLGATADAGGRSPEEEDVGCSCEISSLHAPHLPGWMFALVLVLLWRRRG